VAFPQAGRRDRRADAAVSVDLTPLLADIALVRALIVHLVIQYGPERGPAEARDAFNTTFDQMTPILENMEKAKGQPTPMKRSFSLLRL